MSSIPGGREADREQPLDADPQHDAASEVHDEHLGQHSDRPEVTFHIIRHVELVEVNAEEHVQALRPDARHERAQGQNQGLP